MNNNIHNSALIFKNIHKSFSSKEGRTEVLHDICGEVPKGKILTLVGDSGSGKSTLLSLCNLLSTPSEGEIWVNGREIRQWNVSDLRRKVGLIFQTPTMLPGTVLDNLEITASLHGTNNESPEQLIEKVGLSKDILKRNAADLSGGQKQRVSLARTLANGCEILLLDEITSALDPAATKGVEELILRINREKRNTIIWVTHDLRQAEMVGDFTWFISKGRLIESAETEIFFNEPQHDLTRQFLRGEAFERRKAWT